MEPTNIHDSHNYPFWPIRICKGAIWSSQCCADLSTFYQPCSTGLPLTYAYIVDVLVASPTAEEHKQQLCSVFQHLNEYGVVINPLKGIFGVKELTFHTHHISSEAIRPLEDKVQAVREFPQPTTQHKLHEFFRLINFYHQYLNHREAILKPLNDLLAAPVGRKKRTCMDGCCLESLY